MTHSSTELRYHRRARRPSELPVIGASSMALRYHWRARKPSTDRHDSGGHESGTHETTARATFLPCCTSCLLTADPLCRQNGRSPLDKTPQRKNTVTANKQNIDGITPMQSRAMRSKVKKTKNATHIKTYACKTSPKRSVTVL